MYWHFSLSHTSYLVLSLTHTLTCMNLHTHQYTATRTWTHSRNNIHQRCYSSNTHPWEKLIYAHTHAGSLSLFLSWVKSRTWPLSLSLPLFHLSHSPPLTQDSQLRGTHKHLHTQSNFPRATGKITFFVGKKKIWCQVLQSCNFPRERWPPVSQKRQLTKNFKSEICS